MAETKMMKSGLPKRLAVLCAGAGLFLGLAAAAHAQCPEDQRIRDPIPGASVSAGISVGKSTGVGTGRSDVEAASGGPGTGAYGGVGMSGDHLAGREPQLRGEMTVENCAAYLGDVAGYIRARNPNGMIRQIEELLNQTAPPVPDDQRQCAHTVLDHIEDAKDPERRRVAGIYLGPECR